MDNLSAQKAQRGVRLIPVIDSISWGAFLRIRFASMGLLLWSEALYSPPFPLLSNHCQDQRDPHHGLDCPESCQRLSIAYAMYNASRRARAGSFAPLPPASFLEQSQPDNSDRYLSTLSCIAAAVTSIQSNSQTHYDHLLSNPIALWDQKGRRIRAILYLCPEVPEPHISTCSIPIAKPTSHRTKKLGVTSFKAFTGSDARE